MRILRLLNRFDFDFTFYKLKKPYAHPLFSYVVSAVARVLTRSAVVYSLTYIASMLIAISSNF